MVCRECACVVVIAQQLYRTTQLEHHQWWLPNIIKADDPRSRCSTLERIPLILINLSSSTLSSPCHSSLIHQQNTRHSKWLPSPTSPPSSSSQPSLSPPRPPSQSSPKSSAPSKAASRSTLSPPTPLSAEPPLLWASSPTLSACHRVDLTSAVALCSMPTLS